MKLDGPVSNGVSIKSNHMLQSPLTDSVKSEGPIANGTSIRGNNQMSQIPLASSVRSEGPKANGETGGISHKGSKTSAGQKEPTNAVSKVSNLEESEEFEAGHYMELVPYTPDPYTPRSPMEENEYLKVVQTANTVKRRPPPSVPVNTTGSLPNSKVGQTPAFGAGYHHYKILEAGGEDPSNSPQSAKGKDISARFNDTKSHYATPEENNDKEVYTSLNANASKESCSLNSSPQPNVDNCISARFNNTKSHYDAPEENNGEDTYTSLNANASKECCFLNGSEQRNDAFELQI